MKLYTRTICPKCLWAKSEIENAGLDVEIINMDLDPVAKQEVEAQGFMAAPILRDEDTWYGTIETIMERIGQESV